jgi:hypothetical protein
VGVWDKGLGKLGPDVVCHFVRESGTCMVKPKAVSFNGMRACVRWR